MDLVRLAEEREKAKLMENKNFPEFRVGDTVKVFVRIKEGDKIRQQGFEGIVIRIKGSGINRTFTVRRVSFNVGIERTFPFVCPNLQKIEVKVKGRTRRSKIYFIRDLVGSKVKAKLKPKEKKKKARKSIKKIFFKKSSISKKKTSLKKKTSAKKKKRK